MHPKQKALENLKQNPAPFMIRIEIKEKADPEKYKYKDKKGKEHLLLPPEGAKKA